MATIDDFRLKILDREQVVGSKSITAFTDAELTTFLQAADGNLETAAGNALLALIDDKEKLIVWSRGDAKINYDRLKTDLGDVARRFILQGNDRVTSRRDVDWESIE